MSALELTLIDKFGKNNVSSIQLSDNDYISILKVNIQTKFSKCIIVTNGLSNYKMPVPEQYKGQEFNEIYFCLPSYWDIEDKNNPKMNWPVEILQKLAKNVMKNNTWYGRGHTIANGNPPKSISETMKQEYFVMTAPISMEDYLRPIAIEDKTIHFLSVIPIFKNELKLKETKGYKKWIRGYRAKNGTEILDDFRKPMKSGLLERFIKK
ncbi:MAG: suppressor of fused domain protein [Brumimicrobium sp.]